MLEIHLPAAELFDERESRIRRVPEAVLRLEHSLRSLSKWESIWEVPFLVDNKKSTKQILSYVKCMSDVEISDETLARLTPQDFEKIREYLERKQTATTFNENFRPAGRGPIVTSELIYYWMTAFNIPFECEDWPFQRLMTLIRIAQIKAEEADPKKKRRRSRSDFLSERAALNAKRREQLGTSG